MSVDVQWNGTWFSLVDTGGLLSGDEFEKEVKEQVEDVLQDTALIIFLADARLGITAADESISRLVRRSGKPALMLVNKVDTQAQRDLIHEFNRLGLGEPMQISASHGLGIGDLLDVIVRRIVDSSQYSVVSSEDTEDKKQVATGKDRSKEVKKKRSNKDADKAEATEAQGENEETKEKVIKVAILGRPNVGKSTLINALLGRKRSIVSSIPGTTRDAVDAEQTYEGQKYLFIDTAGLRHKARITDDIEYYSTNRTAESLREADVALLMLDAAMTISEQDQRIAGFIEEIGCGCIVIVNKWDLIEEKDEHTINVFEDEIVGRLKFLQGTPFVFISAKTKQRVSNIYGEILKVYKNIQQKIATSEINRCMEAAFKKKPPPNYKGKRLKLYYSVQTGNRPFIFSLFVNNPQLVHFSYKRYLENCLREHFVLDGVPFRIVFRAKKATEKDK
jgi:GTP-binding protein